VVRVKLAAGVLVEVLAGIGREVNGREVEAGQELVGRRCGWGCGGRRGLLGEGRRDERKGKGDEGGEGGCGAGDHCFLLYHQRAFEVN